MSLTRKNDGASSQSQYLAKQPHGRTYATSNQTNILTVAQVRDFEIRDIHLDYSLLDIGARTTSTVPTIINC
jgi:hypothetical protein